MDMTTVSMTVPREMLPFLTEQAGDHSFERNAMLLYPFIRNLTLSHGRAAEIMGVHKFDLIDFYTSMGIPYLNQSVKDLEDELADIHGFEGADR